MRRLKARQRTLAGIIGTLVAMSTLVACGDDGSTDPGATATPTTPDVQPTEPRQPGLTEEERAAALEEGRVTWYTAQTLLTAEPLATRASAELGIEIEIVRLSSGALATRLLTEFEGGVRAADVMDISSMPAVLDFAERDMLQPWTPTNIDLYIDEGFYDPEHRWFAEFITATAVIYNEEIITGDMIPDSYADLTDPKYRDLLVMGDAASSGTARFLALNLLDILGPEYFEGLRDNGILYADVGDQTALVASGERPISLGAHGTLVPARAQGLPLNRIFPPEGTFAQLGAVGVLANAERPNAAKLFADWLLSVSGQQMIVDGGLMSVLDLPELVYPEPWGNLAEQDIVIETDFIGQEARYPEVLDTMNQIFHGG